MNTATATLPYGASLHDNQVEFRVWAPRPREIALRLTRRAGETQDLPMRREGEDFVATAPAAAGDRYSYVLDNGLTVPDPVSRLLPDGVHGPTEIVDPAAFRWSDRE